MKRLVPRVLLIAAAAALVAAQAVYADAGSGGNGNKASAVFVQTNEPGGNRIVVYDRGADGLLTFGGAYATGGNGGAALRRLFLLVEFRCAEAFGIQVPQGAAHRAGA